MKEASADFCQRKSFLPAAFARLIIQLAPLMTRWQIWEFSSGKCNYLQFVSLLVSCRLRAKDYSPNPPHLARPVEPGHLHRHYHPVMIEQV